MMENTDATDELECRKVLMDFYTQQLNAHSRLLIGFAALLFTLVQIKLALMGQHLNPQQFLLQFLAFYITVFLVSFGSWFLLLRHLGYGTLANAVMHVSAPTKQKQSSNLDRQNALGWLHDKTREEARKRYLLFKLPCVWFHSFGIPKQRQYRIYGLMVCGVFAFFTAFIIWILVA
jgi:hypothetical protein